MTDPTAWDRRLNSSARIEGRASLDAVRAIAALGVIAVHLYQLFLLYGIDVSWGRAGDAGVQVFFVLSGYLIASSVLRVPDFSRRSFAIRRAARILPLYYVSMVIALVLVDPGPLLSTAGRADVLVHLLLLQSVSDGMRYSIVGVWWTLSIEWLFYIWMVLVGPKFRQGMVGWGIAAAMVVLGPLWRHVAWEPNSNYLVQQLPGAADQFGIGMLLALATQASWYRQGTIRTWARNVGAVIAVVVLPVMLWIYHDHHATYWRNTRLITFWPLVFSVGVAALLLFLLAGHGTADRIAERCGMAALGRISYGLFLMHPFVIGELAQAWFPLNPQVPVAPFLAMALAGTTLLAVFLHRTVELPAMAWSRRVSHIENPASWPEPSAGPIEFKVE